MAKAKNPSPIAATVRALQDRQAADDLGGLKRELLAAIEQCPDGKTLRKLLTSPPCEDATYGEAEYFPEVAHALLARAAAWTEPDDVVEAIRLCVRAAAFHPGCVLMVDRDPTLGFTVKNDLTVALEQHVAWLREATRSPQLEVRVAAAHALWRCRNLGEDDITELVDRMAGERQAPALATFVIATALSLRRNESRASRELADRVRSAAQKTLAHKTPLVRSAAAIALALGDPAISRPALAALVSGLQANAPLPRPWGWSWPLLANETTATLVGCVLPWVRPLEPSGMVDALLASKLPAHELGPALIALGLEARGVPVHTLGVAREELDDEQRQLLLALSGERFEQEYDLVQRLGLWGSQDVEPFLAGTAPPWKPLEIEVDGTLRRWHFGRIWRARIHDLVTEPTAVEAIVRGLEPEAVLSCMLAAGHRALVAKGPLGPAHWVRDQALVVAVLRALVAKAFDIGPALDAMATKSAPWDRPALAVCLLSHFGAALPDAHDPVVQAAARTAKAPEPLGTLIGQLDPERQARLLAPAPPRPAPTMH